MNKNSKGAYRYQQQRSRCWKVVPIGLGGLALTAVCLGAVWLFRGSDALASSSGKAHDAVDTAASIKRMRDLAGGILMAAVELNDIAQNLKGSCDKAGVINQDREAIRALKSALQFFKRDGEINMDEAGKLAQKTEG